MTDGTHPKRRLFTMRHLLAAVLLLMVVALVFDYRQRSRRDAAAEALFKYSGNPRRDPDDPRKIIALPDPALAGTLRDEIHREVFGGAQPAEVSEDRRLSLKESWTFPGVFTNYVLDVTYYLVTDDLHHPDSRKGKDQKYPYEYGEMKTRNLWRSETGPLIPDKEFSAKPNWGPAFGS